MVRKGRQLHGDSREIQFCTSHPTYHRYTSTPPSTPHNIPFSQKRNDTHLNPPPPSYLFPNTSSLLLQTLTTTLYLHHTSPQALLRCIFHSFLHPIYTTYHHLLTSPISISPTKPPLPSSLHLKKKRGEDERSLRGTVCTLLKKFCLGCLQLNNELLLRMQKKREVSIRIVFGGFVSARVWGWE